MTDAPQALRIQQLQARLLQCQIVPFLLLLELVELSDVAKFHQSASPTLAVRYRAVTCADKLAKWHQAVFDENLLRPARLAVQRLV